ncbi:MAG: hypothetical protein NT173_01840 [Opitutales bacterium]|nr:hypothetical protein [Opitutales bacterium]
MVGEGSHGGGHDRLDVGDDLGSDRSRLGGSHGYRGGKLGGGRFLGSRPAGPLGLGGYRGGLDGGQSGGGAGGEPALDLGEGGGGGRGEGGGGLGERFLGGGEGLLGAALQPAQFGGGLLDLGGGLGELGALGRAEGGELALQFVALLVPRAGELGRELGHLVLQHLGHLLGLGEILLRQLGDLMQAGGGDADLLGGGGQGEGERLQPALPVVQGLVLHPLVAQHEGDDADDRPGDHAGGDGVDGGGRQGAGAAVGDQPGREQQDRVSQKKNPLGQFGGRGGRHHGAPRAWQ